MLYNIISPKCESDEGVMKFSQQYGYSPVRNVVQLESMDDALRNSLWNALEMFYWEPLYYYSSGPGLAMYDNRDLLVVCRGLWVDFFKKPLDTLPHIWPHAKRTIRDFFFGCRWPEVYDCIEFIAQEHNSPEGLDTFQEFVNQVLERELSGYRLVNGHITPITNPVEINAIDNAINKANKAVSDHLERALGLLSDRHSPDYRNSVKESISAVEAQVKYTLGIERGTLGALLNQLDQKVPLHSALKDAFSKLYGYTSDESGIRHALMEGGREVTFDEAKFMLVTCSAFINYVRGVTAS